MTATCGYYLMEKDPVWISFGKWVKDNRIENRLSQEAVAKRAGMTKQQWSRIELGESGTKRTTIKRIASALGVTYSDALTQAGFQPEYSDPDPDFSLDPDFGDEMEGEDIRRLISLYTGLPKDQKKLTLAQMEAMREYYRKLRQLCSRGNDLV